MSFPLFKLPILVIKLILETMGFIDLFILTSSSSKTKRIVKNLVTIRNHNMRISMKKKYLFFDFLSNSGSISVGQIYLELEESQPNNVFCLKIGTTDLIPSEFSEATDETAVLTIYWSTTSIMSVQKLYSALIEIFRMPLKSVHLNFEDITLENCRNWINWNNTTLSDASRVECEGKCTFHNYISILELVKTNNCLSFGVEPIEYPEDQKNVEILIIEAKKINIFHGKWMNVQQLKTIRAQDVFVAKTSLTDSQINSILREMRDSEEVFNFKQLYLVFNRNANTETVLEGIDVTDEDLIKPDDALNQWNFEMANGEKCTMVYVEYESDVQEFGFVFHVGV